MKQSSLPNFCNKYKAVNPRDVVFTPDNVAQMIVDYFNPTGLCLDPCRGEGAFFKYLPCDSREWCEITEGRDFFDYHTKVDWIISNPPFSDLNDFLVHSFEISKNVVYLTPCDKIFNSWNRILAFEKFGGIKTLLIMHPSKCKFKFGFPVGVFHFVKNYKGFTNIEVVT